jgi:microcystin-dependent protein
VDVPLLGIQNGDSLSFIEQSIINFLSSTLDGTGILPIIPASSICPTVDSELPDCSPLSLNNYLTAITQALCKIEESIVVIEEEIPTDPYILGCITVPGITDDPTESTDTQAVLQAVINKLCQVSEQLTSFIEYVANTYVAISDINSYIESYIESDPNASLISNRMAPYTVQAYFGPLSNFDGGGAGLGDWANIYLCNGTNGTPDLRGRVIVGVTDMLGNAPLDGNVDPSNGNPDYGFGDALGTNNVTLTTQQLPVHTHSATALSTLNPSTHTHKIFGNQANSTNANVPGVNSLTSFNNSGAAGSYAIKTTLDQLTPIVGQTSGPISNDEPVTQTIATNVTVQPTGGGESHENYQPGRGGYYIIYLP